MGTLRLKANKVGVLLLSFGKDLLLTNAHFLLSDPGSKRRGTEEKGTRGEKQRGKEKGETI
jgi:hypothetical protein